MAVVRTTKPLLKGQEKLAVEVGSFQIKQER